MGPLLEIQSQVEWTALATTAPPAFLGYKVGSWSSVWIKLQSQIIQTFTQQMFMDPITIYPFPIYESLIILAIYDRITTF